MTTMIKRASRPMRWLLLALGTWASGLGGLPVVCIPARAELPKGVGEGTRDPIRIHVSFGRDLAEAPIDGRLLVMLSTDDKGEPRLQINDGPKTQQIFGVNVDALAPDHEAVIDEKALGYPVESLHRSRPVAIGFRPSCTGTRRFTAPTGTP